MTTEDQRKNFFTVALAATAHLVGEVAVAAAPAAVPLASAKAASHIFCAGNPSRLLEHSRRCH